MLTDYSGLSGLGDVNSLFEKLVAAGIINKQQQKLASSAAATSATPTEEVAKTTTKTVETETTKAAPAPAPKTEKSEKDDAQGTASWTFVSALSLSLVCDIMSFVAGWHI